MLLVTVSHTRMRCCMSDPLRTEIRACVFQVSHRIYPITYITTGIWSESGASHESFSHACQITCAYSHSVIHSVCPLCLHVQSLYCVSLCLACTSRSLTSCYGHQSGSIAGLAIGIRASRTDESLAFIHIVRVIHIRCRSQSCVDRTPSRERGRPHSTWGRHRSSSWTCSAWKISLPRPLKPSLPHP